MTQSVLSGDYCLNRGSFAYHSRPWLNISAITGTGRGQAHQLCMRPAASRSAEMGERRRGVVDGATRMVTVTVAAKPPGRAEPAMPRTAAKPKVSKRSSRHC